MKVKFLPQDVEYEIELNETVLHLAQRNDIHIQSVCKGLPSCAECRIQIKSGENNVPPPGSKEMALIGTAYYVDQSRLSCQLRCFGDVVVDLSEQIEKEKRAKGRPTVGPSGRSIAADRQSNAIKGSIIEEYKEDKELVSQNASLDDIPGHDNFYDDFKREKTPAKQGGGRGGQGGNPQRNKQHKNNPHQRNNNPNRGGGRGPRNAKPPPAKNS